jgi:hypothetical protein
MSAVPELQVEIVESIDSGLYGKVYRARQAALGRNVAVKIIKPEWCGAADAIAHARAIAQAGPHSNVVTIYGVETVCVPEYDQPQAAIIMEWLEGEKLADRLAGPQFTQQEVRRVCVGVLDGVEHLHGHNVAHGDLHPGNVFLLSDCAAKIIDVDANKDHSLARLSTISCQAALQSDIEYCANIIYRVFSHGPFSIAVRTGIDAELRQVQSLENLRGIVNRALEGEVATALAPAIPTALPDTSTSLVTKVQQYLDDKKPASLGSLMLNHTRQVCEELASDKFSLQVSPNEETVKNRVRLYDETLEPLRAGLSAGCYWGGDSEVNLWTQCIESVANTHADKLLAGSTLFIGMLVYPALTLLYAAAIGAFLNERFNVLWPLLRKLEYMENRRHRSLATEAYHWKAEVRDNWNHVFFGKERRYTPVSDHLLEITKRAVGGLVPVSSRFQEHFDRFEYFLGLVECYGTGAVVSNPDLAWAPVGSFIWRSVHEESGQGQRYLNEISVAEETWPPLAAGFFGRTASGARAAVTAYERFLQRVRESLSIW